MDNEKFKEYANRVVKGSLPGISSSNIFLSLFSGNWRDDATPLIQLGVAIMLDKLIVIICQEGTPIPKNIYRLALAVEFYKGPDDIDIATRRALKKAGLDK